MKLQNKDHILFLKKEDIMHFESSANKVIIHYTDGRTEKISETLDSIHKQINDPVFIRIHENHIVNIMYVLQIPDDPVNMIELNNHEFIPISGSVKNQIITIINSHL